MHIELEVVTATENQRTLKTILSDHVFLAIDGHQVLY